MREAVEAKLDAKQPTGTRRPTVKECTEPPVPLAADEESAEERAALLRSIDEGLALRRRQRRDFAIVSRARQDVKASSFPRSTGRNDAPQGRPRHQIRRHAEDEGEAYFWVNEQAGVVRIVSAWGGRRGAEPKVR